jgi:hypothetical protein
MIRFQKSRVMLLVVNVILGLLFYKKIISVLMDFAYVMYHKRLNWECFFPKGEKEPLYSLRSGSKIAHYIEVVQKGFYKK